MDPATSELATEDGRYRLEGADRTADDMIAFWSGLLDRFPIVSIEDPLGEDDWAGLDEAGRGGRAAEPRSSETTCSSRTWSGWSAASASAAPTRSSSR